MRIQADSRFPIAVVVLALVAAACGGGDAGETTTTTTGASTTTTAATTTTTTQPATTTTSSIPGDPLDFGPSAGDPLGVLAISHDSVLNLRGGPGTDFEVVEELGPTAEMVALGNTRQLPESIWYQVDTGSTTGWVSASYVAIPGVVDDLTAVVEAELGSLPTAETMLDLGGIVADVFASEEPASRVRMSVAPTVGDLGEVTFDVFGLGDDAQAGYRLRVFAEPSDGGEGFVLTSVEGQVFCLRGATADGLCV
jgi:hypothetical protein